MKQAIIIAALGVAALFLSAPSSLFADGQSAEPEVFTPMPSRDGGTVTIDLEDRDQSRWLYMPIGGQYIYPLQIEKFKEADIICQTTADPESWAVGFLRSGLVYCTETPEELMTRLLTEPSLKENVCKTVFGMRFAGFDGMKIKCSPIRKTIETIPPGAEIT